MAGDAGTEEVGLAPGLESPPAPMTGEPSPLASTCSMERDIVYSE